MNRSFSHLGPAWKVFCILAAAVAGLLISRGPYGRHLDRICYDSLAVALPGDAAGYRDILIIAIDEDSFAALNRQWPWPRRIHAGLLDRLFNKGAKAVAFDVLFPEPSDPADDNAFARSLNENVILAASIDTKNSKGIIRTNRVLPYSDFLDRGVRIGLDILPIDPDGFLRKSRRTIGRVPAFASAAAAAYCRGACNPDDSLDTIDTDPAWIRFAGPPGSIRTIPYYQALDPGKFLPENIFQDKLVLVGFSTRNTVSLATAWSDHYMTPHVRFGSGQMSGVEIQANIAANFIHHNRIRPIAMWFFIPYCFLISALCVFITIRTKMGTAAFGCFGLVSAALVFSFFALSSRNVFVPAASVVFPAFFSWFAGAGVQHWIHFTEKQHIRKVFSRYHSKSVVNYLLKHPDKLNLGGDIVEGTVLFLDIEKFTTLTSHVPADTLIRILSRYLGRFCDIVIEHHGIVDKISGDAVMAVWGVPVPCENHAELACRAALEIQAECRRLQEEDRQKNRILVNIRIGINSGQFLAGNVRGKHFSDFTVHGTDVNLARRLEALNKKYGTRILIGEKTKARLPEYFSFRSADRVKFTEHLPETRIYELVASK